MQTKIKFMTSLKCGILKAIVKNCAALIVALLITTGILGAAFIWQPTVSGQELFDIPKLEVLPPSISDLPNDVNAHKEKLDIAYLSAEKDSQLVEKLDHLIAKAGAEGSVPVIIGFRFDFKLDGNLSHSLITDQRAEIKLEQESVLQKIKPFAPKNVKQFSTIPYFAATVDAATLEYLKSLPEITSVSEDEALAPTLAESVPLVGAPTAWANGYSGSGWTVAILDTGVNKAHTFLTNKVISEACYSTTTTDYSSVCPGGVAQSTANGSGYNCVDTISGCDHGTHVAGIAAGTNANFSGVAKDAKVISIQVFSKEISTNTVKAFVSDEILGLERVMVLRTSYNIAAVNMSLGSDTTYSSNCDTQDSAETTAITNLRSVNIATVISSGNSYRSTGISFPACISTAVSVGSTGDGSGGATVDKVSDFSNSAAILDLLAPGQLINSSVPGNVYENKSGTSMAAPHVAGAWAVLKQRVPNASVDTILNALRGTGLPIIDSRNNLIRPRIRIDAALRQLSGGTCGYSIPSAGVSFSRFGGGGTFPVNATESDCGWTATSNSPSWLPVTSGANGTGDGSVSYLVAANNTTSLRTGTITVGGQTFTVTQQGDCVTAISPTSRSVGYGGDSGSYVGVSATSGCNWTASSNRSWISVTGYLSNGFTYSVASNATGVDRTGAIIVLGKTFTITQSGNFTNCQSYTPIALNQTINGALTTSDCTIGGSTSYVDQYSFNGTAGQKIAITMRSITLSSGKLYLTDPNGDFVGNGSSPRVPAYNGFLTLPVSGTYKIFATSLLGTAVGTYSLTLNDEATCGAVSISPTSRHFPVGGGSSSFDLTINSSCVWSAGFIYNGWLSLSPTNPSSVSGIGSSTINYTVAANSNPDPRSETVLVNGISFVVTQDGTTQTDEADVFGRPNGDHFVDSDDIQQIRRFALGLDTAGLGGEYQRADASPRTTLGDGYIDSDDVVQARRYALGLDTLQLAGGPSNPPPIAPPADTALLAQVTDLKTQFILFGKPQAAPAAFRVDAQNTSAGTTLTVPIRVDTVGNEAGYTFSIAFDSTKLTNPNVVIGDSGGDVLFNANNPGQIGFSVTTFSGGTIAEGNNKTLVTVTFTVAANASAGTVPITFTDQPARRKASPVDPNFPITQPTYTGGTITISGATAAGANVSGRAVTADGRRITNVQITMTGTSGETRTTRTTAFGYFRFADVPAGQSYVITARAKRFTFAQNTQTRSISSDISDVEFVADR